MIEMDNTRQNWDRMAGNYQAVFRMGLNEYNTSLLRFWQKEGMLFPGARVIDIGCGVGKYGTYLAELGYDVTLTDISGEMLHHAKENMAKYHTPWTVYRSDFNEVTGQEEVFADGFDLAISTMSPAVHDAETVRKMSSMTRGWCFLARFCEWQQPFRDKLIERMGRTPRPPFSDLKGDCVSIIRAVNEAGFSPLIKYVDYNWSDTRTPAEMADYMNRRYFADATNAGSLRAEALRIAETLADADGKVHDNVNTKVSWIYWKTKGE